MLRIIYGFPHLKQNSFFLTFNTLRRNTCFFDYKQKERTSLKLIRSFLIVSDLKSFECYKFKSLNPDTSVETSPNHPPSARLELYTLMKLIPFSFTDSPLAFTAQLISI